MVVIALAAFLASAAFAPIGLWYLSVTGYALLFRKISHSQTQILHFFLFGFIYNAIVLHWSGKFVGAPPWLLLALLQAIFYLPVGYVAKKLNNIWWTIFALLLTEELRAISPFGGFGWTRIAFSQVESPALPIVSYGGVFALSALTLVIAALSTRISLSNLIKLALIFIFVCVIPANPQGSGSLNLLAIQGNTPSVGLDFNSRAKAVFDLHRDATYRFTKQKYDAIVWPENAIDIDPNDYPDVATDIREMTGKLQAPLIAGVVLNRNGAPANASVLYNQDGKAVSTYIKRGLTPFGEYMPLRTIAEIISPYAKSVNDFQAGTKLTVHDISGVQVGPVICYEIIKDKLVAEMAQNSAALIVQTNSATFAGTAESRQQLAITRIRAVEHSRDILSVSTIGISAFIDNNGRVVSQTVENVQAPLAGNLAQSRHNTLANRLGNWTPVIVLIFISIFALGRSRKRRYL
ncbi:Lnt Apolipoprotein N-acyltransferase [Candidatus Nanopelagicaceae bacterium]